MESHMKFWMGKGWESLGSYLVDLVTVLMLSLLIEWLSRTTFLSDYYSEKNSVGAGLIQTALYGVRMTMAYLVMLAVMSFNAGIFFAAVAGFSAGFLVFGNKDEMGYLKPSDLPPLNC